MSHSVLRLPEVKKRTGLSRSTIYGLISRDAFPTTIQLGPSSVGWVEAEVEAWLEARIQSRDGSRPTSRRAAENNNGPM